MEPRDTVWFIEYKGFLYSMSLVYRISITKLKNYI